MMTLGELFSSIPGVRKCITLYNMQHFAPKSPNAHQDKYRLRCVD